MSRLQRTMQPIDAGGIGIGGEEPPRIMGVLNVSEESPYDPSVFTDPTAAAAYVDDELIAEGADIVDIGLESANKRFDVLSAAEELERLPMALDTIESTSGDALFSIETRYASVAEEALSNGFDMVNDICGFADPDMPAVTREYDVPVVKMAGPQDLTKPGALASVDDIYAALASDPLPPKTIIDPAFGGWSEEKGEAVDQETFHRLSEFRAIGKPMLVSINRKNFLRHLVDRTTEKALPASLAATALAVERGADVIRTHDVATTRDAALIGDQFATDPIMEQDLGIVEIGYASEGELYRHLESLGAQPTAAIDGQLYAFALRGLDSVDAAFLQNVVADCGAHLIEGDTDAYALFASHRDILYLDDAVRNESAHLERVFDYLVGVTG